MVRAHSFLAFRLQSCCEASAVAEGARMGWNNTMAEMIGIPEIAKRLGIDGGTVRRFVARENETLKLTLVRGKGEKLLLSRVDAERLIASYKARRGPVAEIE